MGTYGIHLSIQEEMNANLCRLVAPCVGALLFAANATGAVIYVDVNSPNPIAPYTNWATAATGIQEAVDVASPDDQVLVTNGVYSTGGRPIGTITNRVLVDKALVLRSVNGPGATSIVGYSLPFVTGTGGASIRCVYLTNGASLFGFTLTNGATYISGGPNQGGGVYCTSPTVMVSNCWILGNYAGMGGGVFGGTIWSCTISNNYGGGGFSNVLRNCLIVDNSNGGVSSSTAYGCSFVGNRAPSGGAAVLSTLVNCTVAGNTATNQAGGVSNCNLTNSICYLNFAPVNPNYTNSRFSFSYTSPLPSDGSNNSDADPQLASWSHLSAGSPCLGAGSSSFALGPDIDGQQWLNPPSVGCDELISGSATGAISAAIQASYTNVSAGFVVQYSSKVYGQLTASSWDFGDGTVMSNQPAISHSWSAPGTYVVSFKAYNDSFPSGMSVSLNIAVVVSPTHYVRKESLNPVAPYFSWATAATSIQSAVDAAYVGGTVIVSNGLYDTGGRRAEGGLTNRVVVNKPLTVRSLNGPAVTVISGGRHPGTTNGTTAVRCVYLTNDTALFGFTLTNGATLTTPTPIGSTIESGGGGVWCKSASSVVSNCVFIGNVANSVGGGVCSGTIIGCAFTNNTVLTSSGGGGGGAMGTFIDCVFFQNSAEYGGGVSGAYGIYAKVFSSRFLNNFARYGGGAAANVELTRCWLGGNSATWRGGGAWNCELSDCLVLLNSAGQYGGGIYSGGLSLTRSSTVVSNTAATTGGGSYGAAAYNSIFYYNSSPQSPDLSGGGSSFNVLCGQCTISNAPLFINPGAGLFQLQSNSPCINAGNGNNVTNFTDLAGNPRIVGGRPDIGAYEYQSPGSVIPYYWLQLYGLPIDGSVDFTDSDGDAHNNYQEWRADTSPTNAASVLRIVRLEKAFPGIRIIWQGRSTRNYGVERSTNLGATPAFVTITTNTGGGGVYTDSSATSASPYFYRMRVLE